MADTELERKNLQFGWMLFALFWILFLGTIVVALLYLELD
jgi:hypothetical protein